MNNLVKRIGVAALYVAITFSSLLAYSGCSAQQNRKALCLENEPRIIQDIEKLRASKKAELVVLRRNFSDKKVNAGELYESTAGYSGAQILDGLKKYPSALLIDLDEDGLPDLVLDETAAKIKTRTGVAVRYGNQNRTYSPSQGLSEEGLEKVLGIFD